MNRLVLATFLGFAVLFMLVSCATDDDLFPTHPATDNTEAPVAGAAAAPRDNSNGGWKW